jgi:uncharacterized membrane protein YeaQ/YmgE (transglycosylase-associated protein family)
MPPDADGGGRLNDDGEQERCALVRFRTDAARFRPYLARIASPKGQTMLVLLWIFVGFVSGFLTSRFVNETGKGLFVDTMLGTVGAVAAGWLATSFAASDTGVNRFGMLAAIAGAIVLLVIYRRVFRKA